MLCWESRVAAGINALPLNLLSSVGHRLDVLIWDARSLTAAAMKNRGKLQCGQRCMAVA